MIICDKLPAWNSISSAILSKDENFTPIEGDLEKPEELYVLGEKGEISEVIALLQEHPKNSTISLIPSLDWMQMIRGLKKNGRLTFENTPLSMECIRIKFYICKDPSKALNPPALKILKECVTKNEEFRKANKDFSFEA